MAKNRKYEGFPGSKALSTLFNEMDQALRARRMDSRLADSLTKRIGDAIANVPDSTQAQAIGNGLIMDLAKYRSSEEKTAKTSTASTTHTSSKPQTPTKADMDSRLEKAYDAYCQDHGYDEGTIVMIEKYESPKEPGGDYSIRLTEGRRIFLSSREPNIGDFVRITKVVKDRFMQTRPISKEDVVRELGLTIDDYVTTRPSTRERSTYTPPPKTEVAQPDISAQLSKAEQLIASYSQELSGSLQAFDGFKTSKPSKGELQEGKRRYEEMKTRIHSQLDPIYRQIAGIAGSTQQARDIRSGYERLAQLERQLEGSIQDLEKRVYDTKTPGSTPTPQAKASEAEKDIFYAVKLSAGRRNVKIVFKGENLPANKEAFLAYLRNESNFPDRQDRETIGIYLKQLSEGGTAMFSTGSLSGTDAFTRAFKYYETDATIREKERPTSPQSKPRPKARATETTVSRGGKLGGLELYIR